MLQADRSPCHKMWCVEKAYQLKRTFWSIENLEYQNLTICLLTDEIGVCVSFHLLWFCREISMGQCLRSKKKQTPNNTSSVALANQSRSTRRFHMEPRRVSKTLPAWDVKHFALFIVKKIHILYAKLIHMYVCFLYDSHVCILWTIQ